MTSVGQAFEHVPFVRALGTAERERLLPCARVKAIGSGEGCWFEGQSPEDFAFVIKGRIKLVKASESGRETILELANPGELLCGSAVLCFVPHCCTSIGMERGTEVLLLPRRDVLELVERSPAASRALMRELTERGLGMCRRVEERGGGQVQQRLALLLLKLADRTGVVRAGEGIYVPIQLTRQDLADLCGTTVETTIRVMSRFEKEGIVLSRGHGFVVRSREALEDVAAATPATCGR